MWTKSPITGDEYHCQIFISHELDAHFYVTNIISAETKVPNSIRSLACKIYLEDDCIL